MDPFTSSTRLILRVLVLSCVTLAHGQAPPSPSSPPASAPEAKAAPKIPVSAEFAKAANLALVAIKNSVNASETGPDKLVAEAINNADAAAISAPETSVVKRIKLLSYVRPLTLEASLLSAEIAEKLKAAPCAKKHPECHDNDANSAFSKDEARTRANLDKIDGCIAATRLALRDLNGEEPKECKDDGEK